jgi:hypothetical protein
MFAMAALTAVVWLTMLIQRAAHMHRHGIRPQDMPTRVLADEKFGDVQAANNALMNLCELPVLFYVLCHLLLVLHRSDTMLLGAAWLYVALRALQASIHVTYNNVEHRGLAYLGSSSLLWLMWMRLAWLVLAEG